MPIDAPFDRRRVLHASAAALMTGLAPTLSTPAQAKILSQGLEGLTGERANVALDLLRSARSASFGTGRDVWMWLSSLCPWCRKYFREFPQLTVPGFRLHYIPFILGEAETGAVAKVIADPSPATFLAFMRGELAGTPPLDYDPYYTGPLAYTGSPTAQLSRHHAHIRLLQTVFDADAGYPVETGLNRQLSTPRTFFQSREGEVLMWSGGFGARQFAQLRQL